MSANYNKLDSCVELPLPEGNVYLRGHIPPRVKAEFETWMESTARRKVFYLRPGGQALEEEQLQPDEYKESMRAVTEAVGAGTFRWGGDAFLQSINQVPALTKLTVLLSRSADRVMKIDQKLNEEKVLSWIDSSQEKGGPVWLMVCEVLKGVFDSTPNFLAPPMTGAGD
jgi:hypothetical protein